MVHVSKKQICISAALLAAAVGYILWYGSQSEESPIEPPDPAIPRSMFARIEGEELVVHREFTIRRQTYITVRRRLVKIDEPEIPIFLRLPETRALYDLGDHRVTRRYPIPAPGLPPGTYEIQSEICWTVMTYRTSCIDGTPLRFYVGNK